MVRIILLVYLGLCLVLSMLQTWLIFPGAATQGQRHAQVRPIEHTELVKLSTPDGEQVTAIFGKALLPDGSPHPDAQRRPTILFFYGNGMCLADSLGLIRQFQKLGCNVMVPDFLGYGMSSGKPGEKGCYATADACYEHLLARTDIDKQKIFASGWSLGAATAADLASRKPVAGLVMFSAFTNVNDLARKLLPVLPTSLLLRHRFETDQKIKVVKCPIFIAHGTRDSIIPFQMSRTLAAAAGRAVTTYDVIDADHNDLFDVGGDELLEAIRDFFESRANDG